MTQPPRPSAPKLLPLTSIVAGCGNAVGVPWAVFRYGNEAGIDPGTLTGIAAVGVVGGTLLALGGLAHGFFGERAAKRADADAAPRRIDLAPAKQHAKALGDRVRQVGARLKQAGDKAARKVRAARAQA